MGIPLLLGWRPAPRARSLARALAVGGRAGARARRVLHPLAWRRDRARRRRCVASSWLCTRGASRLPGSAVAAAGSAVLIVAADRARGADRGLADDAASQGDEMLALALGVCVGVGLVGAALALAPAWASVPRPASARRRGRVPRRRAARRSPSRSPLAAGVPGEISDALGGVQGPGGAGRRAPSASRAPAATAATSTGSRRSTPTRASRSSGIGPGTYEFWWAREGSLPAFVRDAHSLYLEALAELGVVGLAPDPGAGRRRPVRRSARGRLRRLEPERRAAGRRARRRLRRFAVAAAIDWVWELTVVPIAFLLLAAAARRGAARGSGAQRLAGCAPGSWRSPCAVA